MTRTIESPAILDSTRAPATEVWAAPRAAVLASIDARPIGEAAQALATLDPRSGVRILTEPGLSCDLGQPVLEVHADTTTRARRLAAQLGATCQLAAQ